MTHEDALRSLRSPTAHERLLAARYLSREARLEDLEAIEQASRSETVLWIRTALQDVLNRLRRDGGESPQNPEEIEEVLPAILAESDELAEDVYAKALRDATSQILHEVEPIVGTLSVHANEEIRNFAASKTKKQIDRLNGMLEAISKIRKVLSPPTFGEFDLAEMIASCSTGPDIEKGIQIQRAGRSPFVILSDRSRLEVAFINGLRNAVESTGPTEPHEPVVVNWGSTDEEHWIAILDSGAGLKANSQRIFDFGISTKPNHYGAGLTTARQALASLGGTVSLLPRDPVGAQFEMRWPHNRRPRE